MPGIIVGIDGSHHSTRALEWALKEAAVQHVPLTVLTVQPGSRPARGPGARFLMSGTLMSRRTC
jgi:nucleotide-binding universal stress UspA family protein